MGVELFPAIDLRGGKVVRLRRGDYSDQTTYEVDPVETAKKFEDAGCTWLHVVDLDGAKEGKPVNLGIIENMVRATKLRVEVGGGIRSEEAMELLLAIGAHRIILGTRALADMVWFKTMAMDARFKQRLVLGLDAKDGVVRTHGWTQAAGDVSLGGSEGVKALDVRGGGSPAFGGNYLYGYRAGWHAAGAQCGGDGAAGERVQKRADRAFRGRDHAGGYYGAEDFGD